MTKTKKNGKIELLRFIFCISVLLFHINRDFSKRNFTFLNRFGLFVEGRIGVEFFFIVTGYLTAAYIYKRRDENVPLGESTWTFMKGKIGSIWMYHLIAFIIGFAVRLLAGAQFKPTFIKGVPNLFFLQLTGVPTKNILNVEWYISAMFMALFVIYPLCRKWYDAFTHIIAPFVGVTLIGWLVRKYGCVGSTVSYTGVTFVGNYIALASISLGVFSFELFRKFSGGGMGKAVLQELFLPCWRWSDT